MSEENETQTQSAESADKTFNQDDVDAIVSERLKRERAKVAERYADYDELKSMAKEYAEIKRKLQEAVERGDSLQAKLDEIESERARAEAVAKVAAESGVDAEVLARMSGDPEANAKFLKEKGGGRYAPVPDYGEAKAAAGKKSTASLFADAVNNLQ